MKNSFTILAFCAIFIAVLSNFTNEPLKSFVITTVNDGPVLPEQPYDYKTIDFPDHLFNQDTVDTGYGSGPIDTSTLQNLNDDAATLGRVLFYDEKLSALENISCASCHIQEKSFADELALSEGISTLTKRNSMALNDLGWSNKSHFFWDMSKTDLHEMIVLPLTDENEIGANMTDIETKLSATGYYPDLFEKAYGTSSIDEERIVDALVQFINSMVTFNSKFDKASEDDFATFTDSEINGLELFSLHCTTCHSQGTHNPFGMFGGIDDIFLLEEEILFMAPFIFNNGLPEDEDDHGAGEWDETFKDLFKIPTLRNVAHNGPYMHDGRFETLEEVIDHYSDGVVPNEWESVIPGNGFNFHENEKTDLLAFLNTLTDESFLTNEKWSNPFSTTSTNPGILNLDFVIKPNPMTDRAVIEFENPENKNLSVSVLSSSGQLIESHTVSDNRFEIDKDQYRAGMYFIEIRDGDKRSLQKLIVQ